MRTLRPRVLVIRSDNDGDVLLAGPAIRAVAAHARVTLVCGPRGEQAARILPGVDEVVVRELPWIDPSPDPVTWPWLASAVDDLRAIGARQAVILTSFHQSPLPTALLLRAAGIDHITAVSEDYPGSLLDVRVAPREHEHEVQRALRTVGQAGFALPASDDGLLHVRDELVAGLDVEGTVVVHPGASVPTRGIPPQVARDTVRILADRGVDVLVTGSRAERDLTTFVAGQVATDLGGLTPDLASLARVLATAATVIVGNTGTAHLAAAVGRPVISVFAPVVPWEAWHPYGVPTTRFGDATADCAGSRARTCPVPGHPCVSAIDPMDLATAALENVEGERTWSAARSMS